MSESIEVDSGFYLNAYNRLGMLGIKNVADIGCGTGPFVDVMAGRNQNPQVYFGVDHSLDKIEEARRRHPGWKFMYADFLSDQVKIELLKYDAYLVLKVLEFIDRDKELLESLPSGKPVVFSAPAFDDPEHKRWFPGEAELRDRYSTALRFEMIGRYKNEQGQVWHMITAWRW
jgi:trans-aconitate methyltransferase